MRQFSARLDNMLGKPREPEFRVIPQRFAILEVLSGSEDHPGAEERGPPVPVECHAPSRSDHRSSGCRGRTGPFPA